MVICDDVSNAIDKQSYDFRPEYFLNALETLNEKYPHSSGDDMRSFLAKSLIISGNPILKYIGDCIKYDILKKKNPHQTPPPIVPQEVKALAHHIFIDNHHDFSMDSRCVPKIKNCLGNTTAIPINAKTSFDSIRASNKYNINPLNSYNLTAKYYIEDTNSTTIKSKLNISGNPQKFNLIANILDSAGCKFCCDNLNFDSISLALELYILNLGFIFYQSYYSKLDNAEYYIYFMISLTDNGVGAKKNFSFNKNFFLDLYTRKKNHSLVRSWKSFY